MFRLKKTKCVICEKVIADGFEKSLQAPKLKKKKESNKNKLLEETK